LARSALGRLILISVLIIGNFCFNSYAQNEIENVAVFSDFSGGLNSKQNSFSLPLNQGTVVQNIRFDDKKGALVKRQPLLLYGTAHATSPITGMHRFYLDSGDKILLVNYGNTISKGNDQSGVFTSIYTVTDSDRKWQWLTWKNIAIGMDGYNYPVKYDGSSASATNLGAPLAIASSTAGNPNGTYTYKVACYSSTKTATFVTPSNSVTTSSKKVNLTMIPLCPDTIFAEDTIGRKVYRNTVANPSTWKLLSNGTIADNSTTTLLDNDADGSLGATYPTGNEIITPPKGRFSIVHNGRLWIGNNPTYPSRVYYSDLNSYEIFYDDSYLDIRPSDGDGVTFLANVLGLLTIGKNNSIQKIYNEDDNPDRWIISDPFTPIGSPAPYSVVNTQYGLMYLGKNGIYLFNGQYSELISDAVTPEIKNISPFNFSSVWATFYKNIYYMAYTSSQTGSFVNNRILEYDSISKSFNIDTVNINALTVFKSGNDVEALYAGGSANGNIYAYSDSLNEIVHNKHSDFAGTWDDMRYIPIEVGGNENSPVLEIAWTKSINDSSGTINGAVGIIDRPDTNGSYTSQHLSLVANSFDKLYWNEYIPTVGGNIDFYLRTGSDIANCNSAAWSGPFSNPTGSNISSVPINSVFQYKINMSTNNIEYSPNIYMSDNYNVRITYSRSKSTDETSIDFKWVSGWMNIKPGYKVTLRKIYVYYDWDAEKTGTLNIKWENYEGDSDTFPIDLKKYPKNYFEYFTGGGLTGEAFRYTISETSLNPIRIKSMFVVFTLEPLV